MAKQSGRSSRTHRVKGQGHFSGLPVSHSPARPPKPPQVNRTPLHDPGPDWCEADPWTSFSYHGARSITQALMSCALIHAQHLNCSPLICYPPALDQSRKGDWFGPFRSPRSYGGLKPVFFQEVIIKWIFSFLFKCLVANKFLKNPVSPRVRALTL